MTAKELQRKLNLLINECADRDVALPLMSLGLLVIQEHELINRALELYYTRREKGK